MFKEKVMTTIVNLKSYVIDRQRYEFDTKTIKLYDDDGKIRTYECIVLKDSANGEIVSYTGLERYIVDLRNKCSESSWRIAVSRVKRFLNFILHDTEKNFIHEINVNDIRKYLIKIKVKENGKEIKSDTFKKTIKDVYVFLINYYEHNCNTVEFQYTKDDLVNTDYDNSYLHRKRTKKNGDYKYIQLGVKEPKSEDHKHRKRTIMNKHLYTMLFCAKMYEPMIYLAIVFMAYAGLREGEVINLSFSDIQEKTKRVPIKKITLSLNKSDKYRIGKSHTGVIKKLRDQDVYDDFVNEVEEAIEFHKDYLESKGLPTEGDNPVFYNKINKPMSETTLLSRIKNLFENYFLDMLIRTSENMDFEGETYAYIRMYEDEYPGAHMFRHWFTMYLMTQTDESPEMIRKWRGDSPNSEAYQDYISLNADLIKLYKKTAYSFQEKLWEDINASPE